MQNKLAELQQSTRSREQQKTKSPQDKENKREMKPMEEEVATVPEPSNEEEKKKKKKNKKKKTKRRRRKRNGRQMGARSQKFAASNLQRRGDVRWRQARLGKRGSRAEAMGVGLDTSHLIWELRA